MASTPATHGGTAWPKASGGRPSETDRGRPRPPIGFDRAERRRRSRVVQRIT